jgi:PiT family inorganic phosphate transporter
VVITSCSVAFAHGANDVANAIGPLAAVVHIIQTGNVDMKIGVPLWVLVLGGSGIVLGLATYGYRVMLTVGTKITEITPSRGVAADIAATATVLVCTRLKLPVSTTHTLVGAIMGIGLARGLGGIDYSVTRKIFTSWFITVPAAALLSILLFITGEHFYFDTIKMWFK